MSRSVEFAGSFRPQRPDGGESRGAKERGTFVPINQKINLGRLGLLDIKPTDGNQPALEDAYGDVLKRLKADGIKVIGSEVEEEDIKKGNFDFQLEVPNDGLAHLNAEDHQSVMQAHVATRVIEALGLGDKLHDVPGWNGRKLFVPDDTVPPPTEIGGEFTTEVMDNYTFKMQGAKVLDLGTGSGILAVAAGLIGAKEVTATDINDSALTAAKVSWFVNGLSEDSLKTYKSNAFNGLPKDSRFDLIFSNPPVQPEIGSSNDYRKFNQAGPDGRGVLDKILTEGPDYLTESGKIITTTTSRHGDVQTHNMLTDLVASGAIDNWKLIINKETNVDPVIYGEYFDYWKKRGKDGDLRVFERPETIMYGPAGLSHVRKAFELSK